MNGLNELMDQGRLFAEQHVPPEVYSQAVPVGLGVLAFGVLISVFGARLVRPALTLAFALAGAAVAWRYVETTDVLPVNVPMPVVTILAGVLLGGFGYLLHRLWVGLLIAALSGSIALSVFGYYRVLPEIPAFQELDSPAFVEQRAVEFVLLDPGEQSEYNQRSPKAWAEHFWAHLTTQHADIGGKIAVIGVAAALVGLLLGLLVTRGALIFATALVGTSLVMSGASLAVSRLVPDIHASASQHPRLLWGAWAGLLLCSLVLQGLLNRRPPAHTTLEPTR